jgi:hypothetical protein
MKKMKKLLLLALSLSCGIIYSQNAITFVNAPAAIQLNTNASVTIGYIADVAGTYQFQVYKKLPNGTIDWDTPEPLKSIFAAGVLPAAPTGGTLTSNPTDLYCDPTKMVVGNDYIWFIKINFGGTPAGDITPATYPSTSIVTTLSTQSFSAINSSEMYVSNASKSLVVDQSNLKSESASVYDVTGRAVTTIKNLKQTASHDLSSLRKGVYFIVTNDKRKLKFAL